MVRVAPPCLQRARYPNDFLDDSEADTSDDTSSVLSKSSSKTSSKSERRAGKKKKRDSDDDVQVIDDDDEEDDAAMGNKSVNFCWWLGSLNNILIRVRRLLWFLTETNYI